MIPKRHPLYIFFHWFAVKRFRVGCAQDTGKNRLFCFFDSSAAHVRNFLNFSIQQSSIPTYWQSRSWRSVEYNWCCGTCSALQETKTFSFGLEPPMHQIEPTWPNFIPIGRYLGEWQLKACFRLTIEDGLSHGT